MRRRVGQITGIAASSQKCSKARAEKSAAGFFIEYSSRLAARAPRRHILPCTLPGRRQRTAVRTFLSNMLLPARANTPARGVIGRFCTKNMEVLGKECRRHARNVFTERSRSG